MNTAIAKNDCKDMGDLSINQSIEQFKKLFTKAWDNTLQYCLIYVKTIDKSPESKEKFMEALPQIPQTAWNKFELVGRLQMLPQLLTDTSPMAEQLKKLPLSDQKRFYGKTLQLVTKTGDLLNVSFHHATHDQARQLFARDHIRTPAEQRAWLENTKKGLEKKQEVNPKKVYEIKNHNLIIIEPCSLTKDNLIQILAEL